MSSRYRKGHSNWSRIKELVLRRDGYQCQYCGYSVFDGSRVIGMTIDHLIEYASGGKLVMENLVASCNKCNLKLIGTTASRKNDLIESREWWGKY